jgi:hypothetical protein
MGSEETFGKRKSQRRPKRRSEGNTEMDLGEVLDCEDGLRMEETQFLVR